MKCALSGSSMTRRRGFRSLIREGFAFVSIVISLNEQDKGWHSLHQAVCAALET